MTSQGIPTNTTLYEVFTRIWLRDLSHRAGRAIQLADVPDAELDRLRALGIEHLWLMGVWTLGRAGPAISRADPGCRADLSRLLPDWTDEDVAGSPYAIARYAVDPSLGGDKGLAVLRARLERRGIGLVLDFVPNHVAPDHHWVTERPEVFVRGLDGSIAAGRDPYFPPWQDTLQLDHRLLATRRAVVGTFVEVAGRCDAVRCDMAMLVLADVFERTWSEWELARGAERTSGELWAEAIDAVRARRRDFLFIAEAYWGLERRLQQLGFDATYDKVLYDRLLHGSPRDVREHLAGDLEAQQRSLRFVENHDEPRIAAALPARPRREAATLLALTAPGLRMLHEGQLDGRAVKTSVHLSRRLEEEPDAESRAFHVRLCDLLSRDALRHGAFRALPPLEAWPGNPTYESFVAHRWDHPAQPIVVIVNYGPTRGQCRLALDLHGIAGREIALADLFSGERHLRDGDALLDESRGLFVDLPSCGFHVFEVIRSRSG